MKRCMEVEDVWADALVQCGPVQYAATTSIVGAAAESMWLCPGGLARARQLFNVKVFADVVWQ